MKSGKVQWGVLAPSGIAGRFVPDLKQVKGAEVVAVASREAKRAAAFAKNHGIAKSYGSYLELVKNPDIDVVYISSVHTHHYAHAKLALEHGKGVLLEKPFTINYRQAAELVELARKNKLFLMEAMWTRCYPLLLEMAEVVKRGDIGDVTMVRASLGPIGLPRGFRALDPNLGGGALLECGVYPLNFAYHILGKPERFEAWAHFTPKGIDDAMSIILGYKDGVTATLATSILEGLWSGLTSSAFISGTKGWIDVPTDVFAPNKFTLWRDDGGEALTREVPAIGNGYSYEAEEATAAVAAGKTESKLVPLDDTLELMRLMDAIRAQVGLRYAED